MDESKALSLAANVITIAAAIYAVVALITGLGGAGGACCKACESGPKFPSPGPSCRTDTPRGPGAPSRFRMS